jgi:hypothetical protein
LQDLAYPAVLCAAGEDLDLLIPLLYWEPTAATYLASGRIPNPQVFLAELAVVPVATGHMPVIVPRFRKMMIRDENDLCTTFIKSLPLLLTHS